MRKRNCRIEIYFTKDELDALMTKVQKTNLSREGFCRQVLNAAEVREAPSADVKELLRLMRRIGGNISQLLHRANTVGFVDTVQLRKDLAELRQARQAIMLAYTGKRCTDNTQG